MTLPLEGIRVLDWTIFQQGPVAAVMLADLGADVIKIEDRVTGDPARGMMAVLGAIAGIKGRNAYFEYNNRGKRSLTLDLRKEKAREILYRLVEKSDVFIHNHRRDLAERLGLDYETLVKHNPRLIYACASGWGPKGPEAREGSFDYTGQAKSGFMWAGEEGFPPQQNYSGGPADQMGAVMTAYGVMTALLVRERYGFGQELDASLLGTMIWLQGLGLAFTLIGGKELRHTPRTEAGNPLWNHYGCQDGKWLVLGHLQPDRWWPDVCKALGMEHLEKDPRFVDLKARQDNAKELISIMDGIFATKTRDEWIKTLRENGVICSPVNTLSDLANDEQALANEYIVDYNHAVWGPIKAPGIPVIFSETPGKVRAEAPEFGQHTEEVLTEILGYGWEEIIKLKDEEVI